MKIQAVNDSEPVNRCVPVKKINKSRSETVESPYKQPEYSIEIPDGDTFSCSSSPSVLEEKYNTACLLAAYYKDRYEQLSNGKYCTV